jgi:hypothetical protein
VPVLPRGVRGASIKLQQLAAPKGAPLLPPSGCHGDGFFYRPPPAQLTPQPLRNLPRSCHVGALPETTFDSQAPGGTRTPLHAKPSPTAVGADEQSSSAPRSIATRRQEPPLKLAPNAEVAKDVAISW